MLQPSPSCYRNHLRPALLSFVAGLLSLLLFATDFPAHGPGPAGNTAAPKTFKGRVIAPAMSYLGADWLERPDREVTQQPEKVLDALKIAPGSTVADIGAGTGYFSVRLAKRVGPQGRVLATDIQPEMLARLSVTMQKTGLHNIEPILCTPTDARLPPGQLDLALMVRRALKPDGRLVLVEYRGEDPRVPIKPEHKMTLYQVHSEIEPMGFRLHQVFEFLVHQRIVVFVKDERVNEP